VTVAIPAQLADGFDDLCNDKACKSKRPFMLYDFFESYWEVLANVIGIDLLLIKVAAKCSLNSHCFMRRKVSALYP